MSTRATELESEVSTWPGTVADARRFGGREFHLGVEVLGQLHGGYRLDVPFATPVRDVLLEHDEADAHDVHPESGWVTVRIEDDGDLPHATTLLRLSYLTRVAAIQRWGNGDQELATVDVARELEALDLAEAVRETVAERFDLERPDEGRLAAVLADDAESNTESRAEEARADESQTQLDEVDAGDDDRAASTDG